MRFCKASVISKCPVKKRPRENAGVKRRILKTLLISKQLTTLPVSGRKIGTNTMLPTGSLLPSTYIVSFPDLNSYLPAVAISHASKEFHSS